MSRNLRKYSQQTDTRLILGALIILFLVGDGLIWLFYGLQGALTGLLCILGGIIPVGLVVLVMNLLDWIAKRANRN
jgi:hypothetical protein